MSYRWCFIDAGSLSYDIYTPDVKPLGGSESALCYLIRELVKAQHEVTFVSKSAQKGKQHGLYYAPQEVLENPDFWHDFQIVVSLNRCSPLFLPQLPVRCSRVYWTQHNYLVPELQLDLQNTEIEAIVFVSAWQQTQYNQHFKLNAQSQHVIQNAVSEAALTTQRQSHRQVKLAYTSTPGRGLGALLTIYPALKQLFPFMSLEVYSSMQVYQFGQDAERPFEKLYQACQELPDVTLHGSVSQKELAQALAGIDILAYPNRFMETSCIAVLEALVSGCRVVTSEYGALPESLGGWGKLVPFQQDLGAYCLSFFEALKTEILDYYQAPVAWEQRQNQQMQECRNQINWPARAEAWEQLARSLIEAQ